MPAVSVLMVFHRDTPFLRPAIASVLGQTWRDLEFVLVDNGTGLTTDALGDLGSDPRLRWVRLPANQGIAAGHNAGVAAAQSEFIALLDYDDLALPSRLERQVALLRADPRLGLVSTLAEAIDETGRVLHREFALAEPEAQRCYVQFAAPFFTPACTGRREVFTTLPYRAAFSYCADFDFVARVADRWPTAIVPEVLLHYRHHAAQTTVQRASRIAAERCAVRLLTARRRANRPEGSDLIDFSAADRIRPADAVRDYARRSLAEGFTVLAAYHARRTAAEGRTPVDYLRAFGIFLRAYRAATAAERGQVARMFFSGPVRALGLRPA
jgi:GT2 family glycosyltransferase